MALVVLTDTGVPIKGINLQPRLTATLVRSRFVGARLLTAAIVFQAFVDI